MTQLKNKHPMPTGIRNETLLYGPIMKLDSSYFDLIDGNMIARAAKMTNGAAGPSTTDSDLFKNLLLHKKFKGEGQDLRDELAKSAHSLASEYIDPSIIDSYVNCHLISLNKCPGVRPIGIGEMGKNIVGKTIAWALKMDIQETAGPLQVCTWLKSGTEAAVHFIRQQFQAESAEACILVDATNAFNAVNRMVMLHNIQRNVLNFHQLPSICTELQVACLSVGLKYHQQKALPKATIWQCSYLHLPRFQF